MSEYEFDIQLDSLSKLSNFRLIFLASATKNCRFMICHVVYKKRFKMEHFISDLMIKSWLLWNYVYNVMREAIISYRNVVEILVHEKDNSFTADAVGKRLSEEFKPSLNLFSCFCWKKQNTRNFPSSSEIWETSWGWAGPSSAQLKISFCWSWSWGWA